MLHGRQRELDALERVLDTGTHRVAIVDGEAGIGKTSLLAEVARLATERGFQTFTGAAEPSECDRPFAAVARTLCVEKEIAELLEAAPARWVDPMVDKGFRVTDAIVERLRGWAAHGPLLIVLDDLHWADRSSTHVLGAIHRRLADLPVVLVVALRTGEGAPHIDDLLGHLNAMPLTLTPLPDDAITALAGEHAGAPPGPRLRRQLAGVGGNPFFAIELVTALGEEGFLTVHAGLAESTAGHLPAGLVHTVLRRLRLLPAETLELLRWAAVLGQSFSVADLALISGRPAVELAGRLAAALRAHTLREEGGQLSFTHALTWEAVYFDRPAAIRRAVHRQVASVLIEGGVPAARVIRHLVLGAEDGDTQTITWLRTAARDVAAGSPATAAELLGCALSIADEDRDSIIAELAPLLVMIGHVAKAEELTAPVLARGADPVIGARLRVGLTHVFMRCGRIADALHQATSLLDSLPQQFKERALGMAAFVHVSAGAADEAECLAEQALAAGERAGHDVSIATALMTLTWTYAAHGRVDEAVAAGQRAVRVTENSRASLSGFLFPHNPLGAALLQADRFDEAERAFREGLARAERTSAPGTLVYHESGLVAAKFLAGAWDEALSLAIRTIDLSVTTGTSWVLLPGTVIARIAVARDDLAYAEAVLAQTDRAPEASHTTMLSAWPHWARAVWLQAKGCDAIEAAELAWRTVPAMRDVIGNRTMPIDLIRIALAGGNRPLAEEIAGELGRMAASTPVPSLEAIALHCRGLVDGDPQALCAAVAMLEPRRYQLAMACEDAATAGADVDRSRARILFRRALALYRELGASRDEARVSATMRALGFRPIRTGGDRGSVLTRTERKVAELVAEGLSNPQIAQRLYISRHTAETHVKHIFAKLNISSRAQLAAAVAAEIPELGDARAAADRTR